MITIQEKCSCTGCEACFNACPVGAITMAEDNEGFRYPQVNADICIQCEKCIKVCPTINTPTREKAITPEVFACKSTKEHIRLISSSGGVFSLIAEAVLEKQGVVFGAGFDNSFNVIHIGVQSPEDLEKVRRSKYVQSSIGQSYKEVEALLNKGNPVLFSGTPCQIAGLQAFLHNSRENLITLEVVCHGVPSTKVYRRYLSFLEDHYGGEICEINFRDKNMGWENFATSIYFSNG